MRSRIVIAAAAASVLSVSALVPAMAIDPGEFTVQLDSATQSQMSQNMPDCTPSLTTIGIQIATGGSADVSCVLKINGPMDLNGTVSNPTMAATYGAAFASGTLAAKCDTDQSLEMKMLISQAAQKLNSFKGTLFQACSWKMSWSDPKSTTLAGTMEMNGKAGSEDGSVDDSGNVDMSMTMKMYVTGGTGEFEGYVGSGEFTQTQSIPVGSRLGSAGGGAAGGGSSSTAPSTIPSGAELQALCAQQGIPAEMCNASLFQRSLNDATKRTVLKVLAAAGSSDGMKLDLVKAAGQVRILSPSAPAGQPGAAAKVKAKSAVEIVATAGSKCIVKNNKKKVVATGTSVSSSAILVMKPKKGAYTGAKTIQATCTNDAGSFKSNKVKVSM